MLDLPRFIGDVHHTISTVGTELQQPVGPAKATSAQIRKSITADGLISFEDGRRYKSMRRHLSRFGLTPDEYRANGGCRRITQSFHRATAQSVQLWPSQWD
ncbi:MAG TPA: MucR family transcriptional regulator [Caulobacteraceae bacterium]